MGLMLFVLVSAGSGKGDILGHDIRIGHRGMRPGLGFGSGCLPKDIRGFMVSASELGVGQALTILGEVDAINNRRRERIIDLAREQMGGDLASKRITVWGAACPWPPWRPDPLRYRSWSSGSRSRVSGSRTSPGRASTVWYGENGS
ncbi:hypothetical protein [Streptomyces sp. P3]|jgi:hypothetical protein|uniref:hypothetical protein n=1 Tax=unclassified Streptomyces TaxID=2593676 RepID=UPI0026C5C986